MGREGSREVDLPAEVVRVTYHNQENGWSVLRFQKDDKGEFTGIGEFNHVISGESFSLTGVWVKHEKYGLQLKVEEKKNLGLNSEEGIKRYLSSKIFHGIGKKTAEKIVSKLGVKTLDAFADNTDLLQKASGLPESKIAELKKAWKKQQEFNEVMVFLNGYGISGRLAENVLVVYRERTPEILKKDPYTLLDFKGVGFLRADQFALDIGIEKDDPCRKKEALLYLMRESTSNGHCFMLVPQIWSTFFEILRLEVNPSFFFQALALAQSDRRIISLDKDSLKTVYDDELLDALRRQDQSILDKHTHMLHYPADLYVYERNVARFLNHLISRKENKPEEDLAALKEKLDIFYDSLEFGLSPDQRKGIFLALTEKVFILTGGPGVGKTTTVKVMLEVFREYGYSVTLAAPTGRAAQRMNELTGEEAQTIHRLLAWDGMQFEHCQSNQLKNDVYIIDETSMVDIRLAYALIQAIPETSKLVLIGDVDQLPSVGPGHFLSDCIRSGKIPFLKLDKVFRQAASSDIIKFSHDINNGRMPSFTNTMASDCWCIEVPQEEIPKALHTLITKTLPSSGYNPIKDVQVLTPMHKGSSGCDSLNIFSQEMLNPLSKVEASIEELRRGLEPPPEGDYDPSKVYCEFKFEKGEDKDFKPGDYDKISVLGLSERRYGDTTFRLNDKVIQKKNNYQLNVFNGDIGYIRKITSDYIFINFAGKIIIYSEEHLIGLGLAYAITIHKSQGSEFPVVLIPLTMSHFIMLQRNLFYTALTRGKKLVVFAGDPRALKCAVKNTKALERQTCLQKHLALGN